MGQICFLNRSVLQQDVDFLQSLFKELTEDSTEAERYRELAELLREINNFAQAANIPRYKLYTWSGFMRSIEGMLVSFVTPDYLSINYVS